MEGEAVRPVEAGRDHLGFALAVAVDHRLDLVEHAVADEQRAAFGQPQRARIGDAAGIDLDPEALRQLELRQRQLVRPAWRSAAAPRRAASWRPRHWGCRRGPAPSSSAR